MVAVESDLPQIPGSFRWVRRHWGRALECAPLAEVAPHLWTTRDLALDEAVGCGAGWQALAEGEGLDCRQLASLRQVHSARVVTCGESGAEADALVAVHAARLLTVRVADCVPLLVADPRTGAVAAVHAGWRGTAERIAPAAVRRMSEMFGSAPEDLVAAIGPSIRPCCYEVGPELADAFRSAGASESQLADWFAAGRIGRRTRLDLARANRDQLAAAGVPRAQILDSGLCTSCHPRVFHSYRRDKERAGRIVGCIRAR
jgi:YfiH family protein